jgi:uncharacterized protein
VTTAQRKRRSFTAGRDDEIMTYAGIVFRPLAPEPHMIVVEDLAHALSQNCRYTGHTDGFYSVAQHSVYVSQLVERVAPKLTLGALLHDASEAYLSDLARPIKMQPELGDAYRACEERLMYAVAERFDIDWPMPEIVKWADDVLLRAEQRDLMRGEYPREEADEFWPETIESWLPDEAEARFLERYEELTGR